MVGEANRIFYGTATNVSQQQVSQQQTTAALSRAVFTARCKMLVVTG